MPKQSAADTTFALLCKIKITVERLDYSMRSTPDNIQALIKVETLIEQATQLKNKIENEINQIDEDEI